MKPTAGPAADVNLTYTPTSVIANVGLDIIENVPGLNINQLRVASALENLFNIGGTLPASLGLLLQLNDQQLRAVLPQLSGEVNTSVQEPALRGDRMFVTAMRDQAVRPLEPLGPYSAWASALPVKAPPAAHRAPDSWNVWTQAFGVGGKLPGDADIGSSSVNFNLWGAAGGADFRTWDMRAGFAVGGNSQYSSLPYPLGNARGDTGQIGVYATKFVDQWYLSGAAFYAHHYFNTDNRAVPVLGAGEQMHASFHGDSFGGGAEVGWRTAWQPFAVTPFAGIQAISLRTSSFSETSSLGGPGNALDVLGHTASSVASQVGAKIDMQLYTQAANVLNGFVRVAWAHEFNRDRDVSAAFEVDLPCPVRGLRPTSPP
jgi:uncharacterized protein with beta-barrel porin domain